MKGLHIALAAVLAAGFSGGASAAIQYDQNVTPDVIFGSGNANGSFTTDRNGGVELGLRGKLRHNASGAPENTFNSNGDGTYSFAAGVAPTQSYPTGVWSFEWSINTDFDDSSGLGLDDLTYVLGLDTSPCPATDFSTIDPINGINPGLGEVRWDHAIGDNSTANGGGGDYSADTATYAGAIASHNVAQNSWKPHWFNPGFDPTVDGTYNIYLEASDGSGVVARTEIQIIVGSGAPAGVDCQPPAVTDVAADPNPVAVQATFDVTATASDAGLGDSNIASAAYMLDGGGGAMDATDTSFDSVTEDLVASNRTAPMEAGIYDLCVNATDAAGNTSADECTSLVVYDPSAGFVTGGGWILSPAGAMSIQTLVWDQDFSVDASGWFDNDDYAGYGYITANAGTASVTGYPLDSAPFSRFDGYRDTWPGTWIAEIDVYLDPSWPAGEGFDYSVAANGSDGGHQRDYIFHVGVVDGYGLLVNGSNNADFYTNPYKLLNDNGGNYYTVMSAGWFTLQHVFYDAGGYLAVDLNLLDSDGNVLWTATRSNVADTIPGEVGGNRYSWFTHVDVAAGITVDNHQLFVPMPSPEGKANFGFVSRYKKGASTPTGNTEFVFQAGDLNFHSASYDWLVVTGSNYAKFKGEGTVNGAAAPTGDLYKFMIWAGDDDPDTFRIKIWYEDDGNIVVYDNGMDQPIGSGQIIIHTGKSKK